MDGSPVRPGGSIAETRVGRNHRVAARTPREQSACYLSYGLKP